METDKFLNLKQNNITNDELNSIRGGTNTVSEPANDGSIPGVDEDIIYPD